MFLYPEKEITNTSILQYGNGESGAAGLAEIVQVTDWQDLKAG